MNRRLLMVAIVIVPPATISNDGVGDVIFNFDKSGGVRSFQIPFEPTVKDIVFGKK